MKKNQELDRKSYRKIVLNRSMLRDLFDIPSHVEITTAIVKQDPLSVSILLTSDYDRKPWPTASSYFPQGSDDDGYEDNESYILPRGSWEKWSSQ